MNKKLKTHTYLIIVVSFVIPVRIKDILAETGPYLINFLIPHSMLQEVRISVILPVAHFSVKALSRSFVRKESVNFLLHKRKVQQ